MGRISKEIYYLNIAKEVAQRSTCLRRKYGAIIVKEDQIISTGYCGSPRGTTNCIDIGKCIRNEYKIKRGSNYELCRGVHAEQNALLVASRLDMINSILYLYGFETENEEIVSNTEPCQLCKRMIINSGIKAVITYFENDQGFRIIDVEKNWVKSSIDEYVYENDKWVRNPLIKDNDGLL